MKIYKDLLPVKCYAYNSEVNFPMGVICECCYVSENIKLAMCAECVDSVIGYHAIFLGRYHEDI